MKKGNFCLEAKRIKLITWGLVRIRQGGEKSYLNICIGIYIQKVEWCNLLTSQTFALQFAFNRATVEGMCPAFQTGRQCDRCSATLVHTGTRVWPITSGQSLGYQDRASHLLDQHSFRHRKAPCSRRISRSNLRVDLAWVSISNKVRPSVRHIQLCQPRPKLETSQYLPSFLIVTAIFFYKVESTPVTSSC